MALKIYWSKKAESKFDRVLVYLVENWGDKVTSNFVKKVFDFLDILKEFHEIGTLELEEKNIRGFIIVKQITIFYTVKNDKIVLLDFFDNRSNPNKIRF